jgi:hypothetical protein
VALRVEAGNWIEALRAGLARAGMEGPARILCDVQADGSVQVTDPASGEVFAVREAAGAPAGPLPIPLTREARPEPEPRGEDLLAEVFERAAGLQARRTRADGLAFLLDLAMEAVHCEAGSVLLSRLGSGELHFAAARGPKAEGLLRLAPVVPAGTGLAGFCAREDVALAVAEAARDPRFWSALSQAVGYETRSVLCAPISAQGRVYGVLELLNRLGARPFGRADLAVLCYLAQAGAEFLERVEA